MTTRPNIQFLTNIAQYYDDTLSTHGATAKGVDWNGEESQRIRFKQLCKIIRSTTAFSVNDLGCGYGALFDYLRETFENFDYCGVDITASMIDAARSRHPELSRARFYEGTHPPQSHDYSIASGIFSVRLETPPVLWGEYIHETLFTLDRSSKKGFAFNCLTSYSDLEKKKSHLYYADPCSLFDFCKRTFSKQVALLHDYGLFEFTILVRKDI